MTSDGATGSQVEVGASFRGEGPVPALVAAALGFELGVSAGLLFPPRLKAGGSSPKSKLLYGVLIAAWATVSYSFFLMPSLRSTWRT